MEKMKYLKYYISTLTLLGAIFLCFKGEYYPTAFFICFSLFIILGDILIKEDTGEGKYSYPFLLNLPMYTNFFLLMVILFLAISVLVGNASRTFDNIIFDYLFIDLIQSRESINIVDSISIVALVGLFIGIMGTVPGHELVHRKKNKFDMEMGNWLLAFSWDCAFAIEHVYGHHKNVGLDIDPATAKRGENIYKFIFTAMIKEHLDAWKIESYRSQRSNTSLFRISNKMISGYLRSFCFTICSFFIGGFSGVLVYLICALIAKSLLEVINYSEHYGLVRVEGSPVKPRHSWNSNSVMSSIYLYNVTRHSSHHEKANLRYWELKSYDDAPKMPQGYLTMLYMALFLPYFFHKMMAKKLVEWDKNFASKEEAELAIEQNKSSGIALLQQSIHS